MKVAILVVVVIVILILIWLWLRRHPKEKDDSRFLTRATNGPPITKMVVFEHRPYQRINRASTGLMQRINPGALKEVVQASANFTLTANPSSLILIQGSSIMTTITVNRQKGFTGKVSLSTSSLPAGVKAKFSVNPTSTSSILTLTATASAKIVSNSTITIFGNSGNIRKGVVISLAIKSGASAPPPSPSFTLALSQSSLSLVQGQSASPITITLVALNGFSSAVTYSTSTLPNGISVVFGSNPSSAVTDILTFSSTTSSFTGTVNITVTGTSGTLISSANLNLMVSSSSTPQPATITQAQSGNWGGYVSSDSLSNPTVGGCTMVTGTFIVPSLTSGVTALNNNVSIWVGLDGAFSSDPTVEQLGIDLSYVNGQQQIYVWYEIYPDYAYEIVGFPANTGDSITTTASYVSGNTYKLTITNNTKNISTIVPSNVSQSSVAKRQSVEWIVEAPSIGNNITPLSEFTDVVWTNCSATIGGVTKPLGQFPTEEITMVSNGGVIKATDSSISSDSGFTVTWHHQ